MLLDYDQDTDKPGIDGYEYHGFLGSFIDITTATNFVHMLLSKLQYENQNCNVECKPILVSKVFW